MIVMAFRAVAGFVVSRPAQAAAILGALVRAAGAPSGIAAGQAWESEHEVDVRWSRGSAAWSYPTYVRDHAWTFGTGTQLLSSAAKQYLGNPALPNPEVGVRSRPGPPKRASVRRTSQLGARTGQINPWRPPRSPLRTGGKRGKAVVRCERGRARDGHSLKAL